MALTVRKIEQLRERGRYSDGHGLYVQVLSPTNRSWLFRYVHHGRERWMGLGPLHTWSLEEARDRARKARQMLYDGVDPLEARKAARAEQALEAARAITFEDAANQYFAQHEGKWKNAKHRAQFSSSLKRYAFPIIGRLPVAAIDVALVLKVLERAGFWAAKPATASRVRARMEAVLDWAKVRGYRTGDNPAQLKLLAKVLPAGGRKVRHHPALPYAELPGFMAALAQRAGVVARALEFLILTAARTGEVVEAVWDEIDLDQQLWTVPAERMKGGREHRVPLSPRAVTILEALPRDNGYVFGGIGSGAMSTLLKRMGHTVTVHGFRSTFRDWCAERTNFPREVAELALAHAVGDAVERAYRRGDLYAKRARLMSDWARYAYTPRQDAAVTPIRRSL
jgi:integrase